MWASWSYAGSMTHRYAANVVMALQGRQLTLEAEGQAVVHCAAALCAVGASRRIDATDTPFLSLNLDPDTPGARRLRHVVQERSVLHLNEQVAAQFSERAFAFLEGRLDSAQSRQLGDNIVAAVVATGSTWPDLDPRVETIVSVLRRDVPHRVDVSGLAAIVDLSPGYLMHLFRQQLGLSMGNFLLWQKMRRALTLILQGQSLTRVAQACGFSDSSHLTRTFQGFYAVRPSDLCDSSYVQARLLPAA